MTKTFGTLILVFALSVGAAAQNSKLFYTVNLNDSDDDIFKITLEVSGLTAANNIYQFASTAPGTYSTMDIGRFVKSFKAYDKKGDSISVSKISVNQYQISSPKKVKKIVYQIAETWDTPVEKFMIYRMCGSSIEKDNVLINGQCVFGYPKGLQGTPVEIKLEYPQTWEVGTALSKNTRGNYVAENYDQVVDSPILLGRLSKASTTIGGSTVEIYTYSKTDLIKSQDLLTSMEDILKSADAFLGGLPVKRYDFLFHFDDQSWGAWEHSYSSEYVMEEKPYDEEYAHQIASIAAHEFFHIVTPLNIHSEIVEQFNFVTPTPSEHLWLYEGTTEWASDMMQLRYGLMDLEGYLSEITDKLTTDDRYDAHYSLLQLSLTSYSEEGHRQYGNIYMRGALVAGLLDIRLLELSGGKRGLREVIRELATKYGPHKAFADKDFFDIFVAMTYPEIAEFFEAYVKRADPLPIKEYYGKLGINYTAEVKTGNTISTLGTGVNVPDGNIHLTNLRSELKEFGLAENDEIVAIDGAAVNLQNGQKILFDLSHQAIGYEYTITVKRDGKELTVNSRILSKPEIFKHLFEMNPDATEQQKTLRNAWMKNL